MVTINLYLRQHSDSPTGIIWLKFYTNREKVHFTTGVKCTKKNWSESKQRITSGDPQVKDKNLILEQILSRCNDVFVKFRLRNRQITKSSFLKEYHRPSDFSNFYDFVKEHQRKISFKSQLSTLGTHNSVISKMREFNQDLHFDDITEEWLDEYYAHLRYKRGNNDNTAMKNMAVLKVYVRAAMKAGYIDDYPFENWKIRRGTASYVYLTEQELQKLMKVYQEGTLEPKYHCTLELFLFLCFSSLHIGDAKDLDLEQFHETTFMYYRVKLQHIKPVPIRVPISDPLRMILRNMVGARKNGKIFQRLPAVEQTMNRYLKEIAKIAGIKKPITLKTGRHTFATIFLAKTKDITALKEILGHSEIKETLIYAHVLDDSKQEGIKVFNNFMEIG